MATHQGERNDLKKAIDVLTKSGYNLRAVAQACPEVFVRNHRGLAALATQCNDSFRDWKTKILWLHGPTGTGKSLTARNLRANGIPTYYKDCHSKWWDGLLQSHKVCVLDDYRANPSVCSFSHLLNLFDGYELILETKGGTAQCLFRWIIVTSPFSPTEVWRNKTEEELAQLTRRVEHVIKFPLNAMSTLLLNEIKLRIQIDCSEALDIPSTTDGTLLPEPSVLQTEAIDDVVTEEIAVDPMQEFLARQASATRSQVNESLLEQERVSLGIDDLDDFDLDIDALMAEV